MLALHDLLADRGQLRALAETPHDAVFRVTLPDARGHGASPMLSGRQYSSRELAADALAVIDAEGLAAVHLAAIGWGANIALAVIRGRAGACQLHSCLPRHICRCCCPKAPTAAAQQAGRDHLEMMQEAATAAEKGQTERALDLFLGARMGEDWRNQFSKPRLGAIRRAAGNLAPLLTGMTADAIDRDALMKLDTPVTLLFFEEEPYSLERVTVDALAALLPRSRTATLPQMPLDQPAHGSVWTEPIARALLEHAA